MKLFTEEQMHSVILLALGRHGIYIPNKHYQDLIDLITPIELPSDEDIKGYIKSTPYYGHCTPEYCEGIEDGIKWTLDKIQGGNK
jgi:hypothetical protein